MSSPNPSDIHGSSAGSSKATWSLETALDGIPKPVTAPSSSPLAFLHIIEKLKTTPREGWRRFDVSDGESIADHMYRMSVISLLCPDKTLDRDRCIKMAIVHDMAEALVGDITPVCGVSKEEKHSRELDTMEYLTQTLLVPLDAAVAAEIMALWNEYEDGTTPEAVFVKDVDKFELVCQMVEYEKKLSGKTDLREFKWVADHVKTEYVRKWTDDLLKEREHFWKTVAEAEQVTVSRTA